MTEPIERKRAERDYSKGIIYKLCCNDLTVKEIYVGSTTNFKERKTKHKHSCTNLKRKAYNLKVYQYIRSNGGWDNWDMILVENYNATDKHHLGARERYWLEELKATLNGQVPSRSDKEYRQENRNKLNEIAKKYYEDNKTKQKEKFSCECGGKYTYIHKAHHLKTQRHLKQIALLHSSEPTSTTEVLS